MSIFQSALQEAARSSPISKNIAALVSVNVLTSQTGVLSVDAARYSLLADIRDVDPPSSVRVPVDGVYRGEKGAIAKADQAVGTGGEHRLQGIPGQGRRLGGRAHAARDVGAANPPYQLRRQTRLCTALNHAGAHLAHAAEGDTALATQLLPPDRLPWAAPSLVNPLSAALRRVSAHRRAKAVDRRSY